MKQHVRQSLTCTLGLAVVVAACAGRQANYYSINPDGSRSDRYSRINQYTSYGKDALGAQELIAQAYEDAQHAPPPRRDIEIYNASLPAGVTIEDGLVKVADDAPYEAIGRYEIGYWLDSAPKESEIRDDLQRLAAVTRADVVVVEVTRMGHGEPRVAFLNGIVLARRAMVSGVLGPRSGDARGGLGVVLGSATQARLAYSASGEGCLAEGEFADEVSARLGHAPWSDAADRQVKVEIAPAGPRYRATVALDGGGDRSLEGDSCRAVTDAVISAVLVHLDGDRRE